MHRHLYHQHCKYRQHHQHDQHHQQHQQHQHPQHQPLRRHERCHQRPDRTTFKDVLGVAGLASGSLLVLSARGSYDSDPALVTKFRLVAATFDEVILV